jgi:hypothetical protein
MGMFDTIRSSYDLGPGFQKDLQTKDLSCTMAEYWISPSGQLYEIDYSGTSDFVDVPEEERTAPWNTFESVPNGNHGKIRPCYITDTLRVYPSLWDCKYSPYPEIKIIFIDGIIDKIIEVNKQ